MTPYEEYVLELMRSRGLDGEPLEPERLPVRKKPKLMTPENCEIAMRMRKSGKTLLGIAKALGYSKETIRTHLRSRECADT